MSTRSEKHYNEIRHLRCLYSISPTEMKRIARIRKFMHAPMQNNLHELPQFKHDMIYMMDRTFALSFEAEGFAPYEGILDPNVTVNGRTTVQPLAIDTKIHASMAVIATLHTFHSVEVELPFKNFSMFFDALRESVVSIQPHVVGVVNVVGEETMYKCYSIFPVEGRKSWTLREDHLRAAHQILKTLYKYSHQTVKVTFSAQDFLSFSCQNPTTGQQSTLHIVCIPSEYKKVKLSA